MGAESGAADGTEDRRDMKKSFVMYSSWATLIANIPTEQAGELIQAICAQQLCQEVHIEDQSVAGMFAMISPQLKEDSDKYDAKCERIESARASKSAQKNEFTESKNEKSELKSEISEQKNAESEGDTESDTDTVTDKDKNIKKGATHPKKSAPITAGSEEQYVDDKELNDAICQFIVHRKALKKPMSLGAVKIFIGKLEKLSPGNTQGKIDLINEAIEHGWQTVYTHDDGKFKPKAKPPDKVTFNNNFNQRNYDYDALERQLLGVQ